ncbi:hypothetical protein K439DRAFT_486051 [Ramaria rubella]|nr:hypothetical protein K439DRAFT_486051 [Ramaria rubella]
MVGGYDYVRMTSTVQLHRHRRKRHTVTLYAPPETLTQHLVSQFSFLHVKIPTATACASGRLRSLCPSSYTAPSRPPATSAGVSYRPLLLHLPAS